MYDFNDDGYITPNDVKLLLSHVPLANSSEQSPDFFKQSQNEIMQAIDKCFIDKDKINLIQFQQLTLSSASDMFIAVLSYLDISVYQGLSS